jgi:multidrug resistance efflux pump
MSQTSVRNRQATQNGPIPYRPTAGLRIKAGSREPGGSRTHFVRSRDGLCQLGEEEYFVFTTLDGLTSFAEIEAEFRNRFAGDLSRPQFQALIDELLEAGIIEPVEPVAPDEADAREPLPAARVATKPNLSDGPSTREPPTVAGPAAAPEMARGGASLLPVFLVCARLGAPLRYFAWLVIPATTLAGALLFTGQSRLRDTVAAMWTGRPLTLPEFAGLALLALVVPAIAKASAAAFHGASRQMFRLGAVARALPGAPIDSAGIAALSRKGRVWSYAAPLVASLSLFAGGVLLWGVQEDASDKVAVAALFVGTLGLASFLLSAMPIWPGDGRRFIAAYVGERSARDRRLPRASEAGSSVVAKSDGRASASNAESGFRVSAVAIDLVAMAGAVVLAVAAYRGSAHPNAAGILLAVAFAAALLWLWVARVTVGPLRPSARSSTGYARTSPVVAWPQGRADTGRYDGLGAGAPSLDERLFAGSSGWPSDRRALRLAIILAVVLTVAFLPYPYESGGAFTVLAYDRETLPARVSGEVTEVLVREGEWVNEGQVVGTLSDWTETHSLALAQAELEQSMAKLQALLISPKPEEVEVALRQYQLAQARLPFSKADYERKLELVRTNDISVRQFQLAQTTYQEDQAAVEITRANYDLVRVGPTEAQLAAARASVQQETEQVSYWKDQLARTRIRATAAGQVVTPDPQLLMGKFLQEGTQFIQLEDHRVAHVEVLVPETDIREVHVGGLIRAKAWGYEHTFWLGKVVLIAPDAQPNQAAGGNVVRVVAEIPNPDGLLRPDMSGYAKVETVYMPVWVSYTRAVMRFVLIEVWSWIP